MAEQVWTSSARKYIRPLARRLEMIPQAKSRRLQRVLTDFGCEHSFARATQSLREHYGFDLGASAVRTATLCHAKRARERLEGEYEQSFRVLPAVQEEHVIAQVDGTMICTVQPGTRQSKRPREWNEMRLGGAGAIAPSRLVVV